MMTIPCSLCYDRDKRDPGNMREEGHGHSGKKVKGDQEKFLRGDI